MTSSYSYELQCNGGIGPDIMTSERTMLMNQRNLVHEDEVHEMAQPHLGEPTKGRDLGPPSAPSETSTGCGTTLGEPRPPADSGTMLV
mmetsp:Transcript_106898/g.300982  ORF Transcript_106898/g.300982 Transcript_106898/m.300982 type:complete len:88 (+) Transcript_106898:83-346(+)